MCAHSLPPSDDTTWPKIAENFCNGRRQSPINIVSRSSTKTTPSLEDFNFVGFDDTTAMSKLVNTGKTGKVKTKQDLVLFFLLMRGVSSL